MELMAAFGGLFLALVTLPPVISWAGIVYAQLVLEPPETRRAKILLPMLILHSGPWVLVILILGGIKLFSVADNPWRLWFVAGFALYSCMMLAIVMVGLRKVKHAVHQQTPKS
ncbi:MAG: hypothetical protein ACREYF_08910 [Gammaproteobacteria bacterium]